MVTGSGLVTLVSGLAPGPDTDVTVAGRWPLAVSLAGPLWMDGRRHRAGARRVRGPPGQNPLAASGGARTRGVKRRRGTLSRSPGPPWRRVGRPGVSIPGPKWQEAISVPVRWPSPLADQRRDPVDSTWEGRPGRERGMVAPARTNSRRQPLRRLLPDRDMLGAVARERLPVPSAPALAQAHSGDARHQIEL